jgi:hypothetical protein
MWSNLKPQKVMLVRIQKIYGELALQFLNYLAVRIVGRKNQRFLTYYNFLTSPLLVPCRALI